MQRFHVSPVESKFPLWNTRKVDVRFTYVLLIWTGGSRSIVPVSRFGIYGVSAGQIDGMCVGCRISTTVFNFFSLIKTPRNFGREILCNADKLEGEEFVPSRNTATSLPEFVFRNSLFANSPCFSSSPPYRRHSLP